MMKNAIGFFVFSLMCLASFGQRVQVAIQDTGVLFKQGKDTVLFYQTAPRGYNGAYTRSNYIHPLYSLDGQILTEDFPTDHLHHRGVFWAWHQLYVGDERIGDGWEIKDFKWDVVQVQELKKPGNVKAVVSTVLWKSPLWRGVDGKEKPLVSEKTTITVYPAKTNYREVDIEISLLAMEPDVRIGGSEDEKGYGGFSPRIRLVDDITFRGPGGEVTPKVLPVFAGAWMDISGSLGDAGSRAGVTMVAHPQNPGYPNPWILRSKGSMQNAVYPYPGAEGVELSNVTATVLKYRLLIHNGLNAVELAEICDQYK